MDKTVASQDKWNSCFSHFKKKLSATPVAQNIKDRCISETY